METSPLIGVGRGEEMKLDYRINVGEILSRKSEMQNRMLSKTLAVSSFLSQTFGKPANLF